MLANLRIKNLAIVDDIRVDFGPGLNVITGETGAGKSIMANALGLVLGGRSDRSMVRSGAKQSSVEASFELADASGINAILADAGLDECEGGALIVRRIITSSGAGRNFINDCPTTVQTLKKVGNLLVDMHGPYDHQSLLNRDFQLNILDSYAHLEKLRASYRKDFDAWRELLRQRDAMDGDDQAVAQQIDLLSFQVKELEDADLDNLDEDELLAEHCRVANAGRILELTEGLVNALSEDDNSAFNAVAFAQRTIPELADLLDEAGEWRDELESVAIRLQELATAMAGAVQRIEQDPERLLWLEDRLALLQKLKRKYGSTVAEMQTFLEEARNRLRVLENREELLREIDGKIDAAHNKVLVSGKKLTKERQKFSGLLGNAITAHLRDLGFAHGQFSVELSALDVPNAHGLDAVDFGFAPNPGEPPRPLRSIASSGEISRVMLAIKAELANHDCIPVLVFDEIDSNVGGEMGNAIGEKMRAVAAGHQVICITHLPQVAVFGDRHLTVAKQVCEGRTSTSITEVKGDARTEEVARMLGGKDLTSVTLRHAAEMLAKTA